MASAGLVTPHPVPVLRVQRHEIALQSADEDYPPGRGKHGGEQYRLVRRAPDSLARHGIPRVHVTECSSVRGGTKGNAAIGPETSLLSRHGGGGYGVTNLIDRRIDQTRDRRICHRVPTLGPGHARADIHRL